MDQPEITPGMDRVIESVARVLVGLRDEVTLSKLHVNELRKHNLELQAKLERYQLKEQQIKKLQSTESYCEMVQNVSAYQLSDKDFVMTYVDGVFGFVEMPGGIR